MTEEFLKWVPAYITTTTPADEAGNFYIPSLVPAGAELPAMVTSVAPTDEQLQAGKPLRFSWMDQKWVASGEDPLTRQTAILAAQFAAEKLASAKQKEADDKKIAALGAQLAAALAAAKKPAAAVEPATDDTKEEA